LLLLVVLVMLMIIVLVMMVAVDYGDIIGNAHDQWYW
jgi:hypothetical protein